MLFGTAATVLSLSACGMLFKNENAKFKNHGKDYLQAKPLAVIDIPDDLDKPEFTPLFPVPELSVRDEFGDEMYLSEYEVPRPDSPYNSEMSFGVKLQKLGENEWISLSLPSNQTWPRVQNYLAVNSLPVVFSNAQAGVIETNWLKYKDDEDNAVRFRIHIEKGIHPETTEIHILQSQAPITDGVIKEQATWPAKSDDRERESWLLRQIAEHLAGIIDNATTSLLGQEVGGEIKVSFLKQASEPTMAVRLPEDRAWGTVKQAARTNGFVQWGSNMAQGVIFSGFDPEATKEKGFWSKAMSLGRDRSLPAESRYTLDKVLSHLSAESASRSLFDSISGAAFDSALPELEEGYLIVVKRAGDESHVVIRDQRGRKLKNEQAKALLRVLRGNLI